ncbi:unnamed protein product [Candidula unifasciata]|uniref:Galectin n=1 Tax=Candidula unifasciata TaxID=100452 RepID=A0A8S3ZZE2_9EUPU|nr:unnamed protein product [Candidula unifasciata]
MTTIVIPYSGYIPGGLHIGTDVSISGRTHHDFKRFSISLCSGPTWDSDCAFVFNPRFDDGRVVRTHKQGGTWGVEETDGGMPFRRGHNFDLHIKIDHHGYKIKVNNRHFCNFHHRLPKEMVQYIYIEGDVYINFIQFSEHRHGVVPSVVPSFAPAPVPAYPAGAVFPPVPSYPSAPSYPPAYGGGPLYNPPVPLTTPIQGGLYHGKIIYISGVPHHSPSRFTINLACGSYDSADYGLTFDVRFNYSNCYNVVVRTHRQNGSWGPEEKHQNYFPFSPGADFEIMILAEHNAYKIAVNGQHYTEFFHRIQPLQRIDYLNVTGDVRLTLVRFQ